MHGGRSLQLSSIAGDKFVSFLPNSSTSQTDWNIVERDVQLHTNNYLIALSFLNFPDINLYISLGVHYVINLYHLVHEYNYIQIDQVDIPNLAPSVSEDIIRKAPHMQFDFQYLAFKYLSTLFILYKIIIGV